MLEAVEKLPIINDIVIVFLEGESALAVGHEILDWAFVFMVIWVCDFAVGETI